MPLGLMGAMIVFCIQKRKSKQRALYTEGSHLFNVNADTRYDAAVVIEMNKTPQKESV